MKFKLRFIFFFSPQTGKIEIYLGIRHFIWNMTKLNCKNVSSFHITAWAKKNLFIQFMICLNYIWFVYVWRALTTAHSSAMQKLFIFKLYIVYIFKFPTDSSSFIFIFHTNAVICPHRLCSDS